MGKTAILSVRILADAKDAKKGMEETATATERLQNKLDAATPYATATVAALVGVGKASIDAASDLQQSTGAVQKVFGDSAATVQTWAKDAAGAVGLSTNAYQEMASTLGSSLKNMGIPMDDLAGQTNDLITLGADLAATYGGTTTDAVDALTSLLRGETDPIEKFGVSIKQSDINAQMAAMGLSGLTGEAAKNAQAQAVLALLSKQTADAQGTFAAETNSAAGAQQIAAAEFENAKAALGESLLPAYTAVTQAITTAVQWVSQHSQAVTIGASVVGGFAAAILVANGAVRAYHATQTAITAATKVWSVAQRALNLVLSANPIGLVITAVGLLVAGIVMAYQKSSTFRGIVQGLWAKLKEGGSFLADLFSPLISGVKSAVTWVQNLVSKISGLFSFSMPGWMKDLGSALTGLFSADPSLMITAAATTPAAPFVTGNFARTLPKLSNDKPTTINYNIVINGAIDSAAAGREVEKIIRRHDRRSHGVTLDGGRR